MTRPGLDQHDTWSYLDGALMEHDVQRVDEHGTAHFDSCPSYRTDAITTSTTLCKGCAYDLARANGYGEPVTMWLSYGVGRTPEEVLPLRDPDGSLVAIVVYGYGRAYFEPGEPRTAPCTSCGTETLVDAAGGRQLFDVNGWSGCDGSTAARGTAQPFPIRVAGRLWLSMRCCTA